MKYTFTSAKFTGRPATAGWAQVHEFKPNDEETLEKRGCFTLSICLSDIADPQSDSPMGGISRVIAGREVVSFFQEIYLGELSLSLFDAAQKALSKTFEKYKKRFGKIEIGFVALCDSALYVAGMGGVAVHLSRKGRLVTLVSGQDKESFKVVSGFVEEGDFLCLLSSGLRVETSEGLLLESLSLGSPESALETLIQRSFAKVERADVSCVISNFFKFEDNFETKSEAVYKPQRKNHFREILSFFLKRVESLIPERRIRVLRSDNFYAERQGGRFGGKKRLPLVSVGIILIAVLFVSVVFGMRQKGAKISNDEIKEKRASITHKIEEARALFEINPGRAKELVFLARSEVDEFKKEVKDEEIVKAVEEEISLALLEIAGIHEVTSELFLDLTLVSNGFDGDSIAFGNNRMLVLDREGKKLVEVAISNKKTQMLSGSSFLEGAMSIAPYADRSFALTDSGVYELPEDKKVVEEQVGSGSLLWAFAGNLYVLDGQEKKIWRFQASGDSFSTKNSWLAQDITLSFEKTPAWAIDGSIWVLSDTGEVIKFALGTRAPFEASLGDSVFVPDLLYTDEESSFLYLLDKENKNIMVFTKDGAYRAEYRSEIFGDTKGFVVSEKENKIIILSGPKLFVVPI